MTNQELAREALNRARASQALTNYPTIFAGFMEKGIPESDILPRENVLTYHAWRALGRQVMKGEKGVKVITWIEMRKEDADGEEKVSRRPWSSTVFHISQTKVIGN